MTTKRVLLKLSGEALLGKEKFGIDHDVVMRIAQDIKQVHDKGVQVAVVVGGGNIFRGEPAAAQGMDRCSADSMGMLATIMNAISMQSSIDKLGIESRVLSAIRMPLVCEPFVRRKAIQHLDSGRIVLLAGGTGNPYFTTDTAAALRASELNCDILFKGTQVDGVYCSDPQKNAHAKRYDKLSYKQVLKDDLRVMDAAAISLARENHIPIMVFSIHNQGSFLKALEGEGTYTLIQN